MIIPIETVKEFDQHLEGNKGLVVVDFTASWCGPCQNISPVFKALSEDVANQNVVFLKVDVDKFPEVSERYKVSAMPTFIFIKNGKIIREIVGANENKLKNSISELRT